MSQLPPGFVLDNAPATGAPTGPLPGAPLRPEKPNDPPKTWRQGVVNGKQVLIGSDGDIKEIPGADNTSELTPAQKSAVANEALQKLKLIQSLDQRSRDGWFATGFGAETAADWFPASTAGGVQADVKTVGAAGALQKIMEMAQVNGGKNPLTPLSNADFIALGESISNLDPTRADATFQKNLKVYADIYKRALMAVGGDLNALDPAIKAYLDSLPPPAPMVGDSTAGTGSFESKGRTITFSIPEGATDQQIAELAAKAAREAGSEAPASQFNVPQNATGGWGKARVVE